MKEGRVEMTERWIGRPEGGIEMKEKCQVSSLRL